ncbi:hypothetical protein PLANPX_1167 [Lacipirellula parvula]|uniref:Uncharacterized protein n=1 Tax=Lacipirellula parvula TaxID=2650471 RepID=A0A5K7X587_9BACT|nr:hypothetical protein PLANPX_1167 [Lacipirellula parvula]
MTSSQAFVSPLSGSQIGYVEQISGVSYLAANPSKSAREAAHRQAVEASLALIFQQDGESMRSLSLVDRQNLYRASLN